MVRSTEIDLFFGIISRSIQMKSPASKSIVISAACFTGFARLVYPTSFGHRNFLNACVGISVTEKMLSG